MDIPCFSTLAYCQGSRLEFQCVLVLQAPSCREAQIYKYTLLAGFQAALLSSLTGREKKTAEDVDCVARLSEAYHLHLDLTRSWMTVSSLYAR